LFSFGASFKFGAKGRLPELHSRKNIKQAVDVTLQDLSTCGQLIEDVEVITISGGRKRIPMLNLPTFQQGMFAEGGYFFQLLLDKHNQRPSSFQRPWQGILYADELHPGNQLSSTARKTWCLYFSWLELGTDVLADEKNWFTLMAVRSNEVSNVEACISQLVRKLLEIMFLHEHGSPLAGIHLKRGDQCLRLFWALGFHSQDGESQRQTFMNRQDTGSRLCQLCKNVFGVSQSNSSLEDYKITSKFLLCSDEEILQSWKRLEIKNSTENKTTFKKWQQACGFTFSPQALLMSKPLEHLGLLRPATGYVHDWMHALCSNGVLCYIMQWALEAIATTDMPNIWSTFCQYLQLWVWPGNLPGSAAFHKLFEAKKVETHKKNEKLVMSASEMLSIYPVLAYFMETCCVLPACDVPKQVYLAWCHVLDLLVASTQHLPKPGQLLQAVQKALALTKAAGWAGSMRPKFHWCLHFEQALQQFDGLPSCWSLERKHKVARRYGSGLYNTNRYEDTLLKEPTCDHLAHLKQEAAYRKGAYFLGPHPISNKLKAYLIAQGIAQSHHLCQASNAASMKSGHICKIGDCVLYKLPAEQHGAFPFGSGHLEYLLECDGMTCAILKAFSLKEVNVKKKVAKWVPKEAELHLVSLAAVVIFNKAETGLVTTLLPPHLT
jgi:hypothetical protein